LSPNTHHSAAARLRHGVGIIIQPAKPTILFATSRRGEYYHSPRLLSMRGMLKYVGATTSRHLFVDLIARTFSLVYTT
ncbi:hypothetical protein WG66_001353, partial [Moniliophthora roreri]